jgi:inner membrane protein
MLLTRKLDWYQVADAARLKGNDTKAEGAVETGEAPASNGDNRFRLWK